MRASTFIVTLNLLLLCCGTPTDPGQVSFSEPSDEMSGAAPTVEPDEGQTDENEADASAESADGPSGCAIINFEGGFNGQISGPDEQCIALGQSTAAVEARPRSGFSFDRWSDGNTDNPRVITDVANDMELTAHFSTTGLSTVFIGYSFIRQHAALLAGLADTYPDHSDAMTFSGGCSGAPGSIWSNANLRAEALEQIATEKPDNVVLGYFRGVGSDYTDYENWVTAAVAEVPRVRIHIVLPWLRAPFGSPPGPADCGVPNPGSEPWIDAEGYPEDVFGELSPTFHEEVVAPLRENFPETEFVIIPQATIAQRLLEARADGGIAIDADNELFADVSPALKQLSIDGRDLSDELLQPLNVVFTDETAHAGSSLRIAVTMTYLAFLYGTEINGMGLESKTSFETNEVFLIERSGRTFLPP
ncbi:MAG: hypothetical protein AAFX94_16525, partial [Myxococcota bacterium]